MRSLTFCFFALALAAAAFAAPYEMNTKFDKDATFVDFSGDFGGDYNASVYLSNIYVGLKKEAKILFVNSDEYENNPTDFEVTTIEGNAKGLTCGHNLVGMFQFVDIYPAENCELVIKFEINKNLKNRIGAGLVKADKFVPVGGGVSNVGSIVTTKYAGGAPNTTAYFNQTDIGWTASYDEATNMVTIKGIADKAYLDIESGCFDVGVVIFN